MFKRLMLCLVLVLALAMPLSAMEDGQQCTLIKGARVVQLLPDQSLRHVITPQDYSITIGSEILVTGVENLSKLDGFNWTGGHLALVEVDFGSGPAPLILAVRPESVKDCK
jgi:hypothetical protein